MLNQDIPIPLLSVAIPTRNRHHMLEQLVRSLLKSTSRNFEIVIHDNSEEVWSLSVKTGVERDPRVRYWHVPTRLSVVDNCDLAISKTRGEFVCMIGDDDGVLIDEALEVIEAASKAGLEAVFPEAPFYAWPGVVHSTWGDVGGRLYMGEPLGTVRAIQLNSELDRVLESGGASGMGLLPGVYQGFVSIKALQALKAISGSFFPGPSPDMANTIALATLLTKAVRLGLPLVIAGHSAVSGGGHGAAGKHVGRLETQTHLPADTVSTWNTNIPFFWSGQTIYAQSAYAALASVGRAVSYRPKWALLYATCLVYQSGHWQETLERVLCSKSPLILLVKVLTESFILVTKRAASFLKNIFFFGNKKKFSCAINIEEAIELVRSKFPNALLKQSCSSILKLRSEHVLEGKVING